MSQQLSASLQRKQGSARQQQQLFLRAVLEMGGASRGPGGCVQFISYWTPR